MQRDTDEGFTLIELLVVMVILGILAAIAVPVFLNQRDKAYTAAMKSDLHAVVVAEEAWVADNQVPTTDATVLSTEGYKRSSGVTVPHVKVTASAYVACVRHTAVAHWLVYDSATGITTTSPDDCV